MNTLLSGTVGSVAYGLNTESSDIDTLGIFAVDTRELLGLDNAPQTVVTTNPDSTFHEAKKYCQLALSCNPTVLEAMWLNEYTIKTDLGQELISIRSSFLSQKRVRDAYLGYATQQFKKLESRQDGSFSSDIRKRTQKHSRHLARLLHQGYYLYTTGELIIKLEDPQRFHDFGEKVASGDLEAARELLAAYEYLFDNDPPTIPEQPDRAIVNEWLLKVREHYWE